MGLGAARTVRQFHSTASDAVLSSMEYAQFR